MSGENPTAEAKKKAQFPLFVDIRDKNVLVVGAGKIASRRIKTLLAFDCKITVCAPEISPELHDSLKDNSVTVWQRKIEAQDIINNNWFMVVCATDNREVNMNIGGLCRQKGIFVSVADNKDECNFYFPGVALGDDITVGITGNGSNHSKVRYISQQIRELISDENTGGKP